MAQHEDMVDSVFKSLFGDAWNEMFNGTETFFGRLFEHINNYAVTLIVIITIISMIGGLLRLGQKREFLGGGKPVSFWVIRLVLFVGCCYPALNGYSIAQGILLKGGVRYSADVGNLLAKTAFDSIANDGMLPLGDIFVKPDKTLMYQAFENAVCFSYMRNEMSGGTRFTNETPLYLEYSMEYNNEAKSYPIGVQWGAKWGGKNKKYPINVCGQIIYNCKLTSKPAKNSNTTKEKYNISSQNNTKLEIKTFSNSVQIDKQEKKEKIKSNINESADIYCAEHGIILVDKLKKVQSIADRLVTGQKPARGELEAVQREYEEEVADKVLKLNNEIKRYVNKSINESGIVQEISRKGFLMLGFHYYQISKILEEANNMGNVKPKVYPPDYYKIDPDMKENKGLLSFLLLAESYRNTDGGDCILPGNQIDNSEQCKFKKEKNAAEGEPDRQDAVLMKKINSSFDLESFGTIFADMDPERPIGSILNMGSNMVATGSTFIAAFVTVDILAHSASNSMWGKAFDALSGGTTALTRSLHWLGKVVITFGMYLISCGILLLFVIPTIPLVTWLFATFAWIIIVVETLLAIPFWAVASSTSSGDGFVADTGRTGITLFLNVIIRPILMPFLFFMALALSVVFSRLIISGLNIFFAGHMDAVNAWDYISFSRIFGWGWKIFIAVYLFVMAFKLSHEIMAKSYDYVMRFVNSMGRSDYGTDAPNSDMMAKGAAFGSAAGSIASSAATPQKREGKGKDTDSETSDTEERKNGGEKADKANAAVEDIKNPTNGDTH